MSIDAYKLVWNHSKQTGGLKLTMLALAEFCRANNGFKCWPAIGTLAEMVGTSDRQIKRNLVKLEESGELVIARSAGRANTNTYDLSPLKGDTHDTINENKKVTPRAEKVTPVTVKGDTHDTRSGTNRNKPVYSDGEYIPASGKGAEYQEKMGDMRAAICTVTKQPIWANNGKIESLAVNLLGDGHEPELILKEYRAGGWWYEYDWRGKKGQRPTVKNIAETVLLIGDAPESGKVKHTNDGGVYV